MEDGEDSLSLKIFLICKPKYIFGKILMVLQMVYVETLHMMFRVGAPLTGSRLLMSKMQKKGFP